MLKKKMIGLICSVITSILLCPSISAFASESKNVTGTYNILVEGFDWGPGVTKAIVTLDEEVSNVDKDTFNVEESKNWYEGVQSFSRTIINAYTSDEEGRVVEVPSKYVAIELSVNPMEGSPFLYDFQLGSNTWTDPYSLNIKLSEEAELKIGENIISSIEIDSKYINRKTPTIDKFKKDVYISKENISMKYAFYEPENNTDKKPLIIWLHGAGEGGSDTTITTLGNKVGALIEDNIQNQFGGAYVLAPQSPTMWMDIGGSKYTGDGSTIYLDSLMDLIKNYVEMNKGIDTNRIYIGGCSNGGFMTMALILQNPEYFAAAYPVCEAFDDSWIKEDKLKAIKDLPIWFIYSKNDQVVIPSKTSVATINRLKNINAKEVRVSEFNSVVDTSGLYKDEKGNPYEYNGHWSWIYAFNDECKDGEESLWSWLAKQEKKSEVNEPIDKPIDDNNNPTDKPNDNNNPIDKPSDNNNNNNNNSNNKNNNPTDKPNNDNNDLKNNQDKDSLKNNLNKIDNDKKSANKVDKLPNTGDTLSSTALGLIGVISMIFGIKMRFNK